MKFRGTLVRSLDEQGDRDGVKIDPAGVTFRDEEIPIFANFDYSVPGSVLGFGHVVVQEDGSLGFEGELNETGETFAGRKLAIGVRAEKEDAGEVVVTSDLMAVSLTAEHADPGQPDIEITE